MTRKNCPRKAWAMKFTRPLESESVYGVYCGAPKKDVLGMAAQHPHKPKVVRVEIRELDGGIP